MVRRYSLFRRTPYFTDDYSIEPDWNVLASAAMKYSKCISNTALYESEPRFSAYYREHEKPWHCTRLIVDNVEIIKRAEHSIARMTIDAWVNID